ncbi:MAG TPA: alpha/beta fold hydrolase [Candidatus Angelobacter sp.]|nr:alpha/beta fold hydrolase [Candidatus Angelobacter sp.]
MPIHGALQELKGTEIDEKMRDGAAVPQLKGTEAISMVWNAAEGLRLPRVEVNERWTEIQGQRMRFLEAGTGLPLLLIHGLLGGSFCWRFVMPALTPRFRVHAVDLPGAGLSDDVGVDCSMSRQAERLNGFIEQMGWNEVTLVATSFGGAIALLTAAKDLERVGRVRSLVLSSPVNPWSDFGQRRIRFLSSRLGGYFLRTVLPISRPCHGIALRRMYADPACVPADALEGYRASVLRRGRAQNVLTTLRAWQRDLARLRDAIPKLRIPTLLIWGARDKAVDPRSGAALQKHLPNSELKLIQGAGHLPFEEKPEEFNRLTLEFLAKALSNPIQADPLA